MTTKTEEQLVHILPALIFVDPEDNIAAERSEEKNVEDLAKNMKDRADRGQPPLLEPISVENGGSEAQPYRLGFGYRRMAAWLLNGWQKKPIPCMVKSYAKGQGVLRVVDMWSENLERQDASYIDYARMATSMLKGTYRVRPGEEAKTHTQEEVMFLLGLSRTQLGRYVKVMNRISPDLATLAKKCDAPQRLIQNMVEVKEADSFDGKGSSPSDEELEAKKVELQEAVLKKWHEQQQALKAVGRKRGERSDKGTPKGKKGSKKADEVKGVVSGTKKVNYAVHKTDDDKSFSIDEYLTVIREKAKTLSAEKSRESQVEAAVAKGIGIGIAFMRGELKKLPLNKADFECLYETPEEEAGE